MSEPVQTADLDCLIVGAGVVGLACARALAQAGREVLLAEAGARIGAETSSRNSEVIHAGLYYPLGSLKARLCVAGRDLLYSYCESRGVAHKKLGKLIVATQESHIEKLDEIARRAAACGGGPLLRLTGAEARALEPALSCVSALHSPMTGIVDSAGLMLSLLGEAEAHGASLALRTRCLSLRRAGDLWRADLQDETGAVTALTARLVVNAAGHGAPPLAAATEGLNARPQAYFARGCYFASAKRAPFQRLIYPVPAPGGLGVHLTLDLGGQARFGPDVEWIDALDYTVDPARADAFYAEARAFWPDLPDGALQPAYAGVRPKISGPSAPAADFRIEGPALHGLPGLVNLFGIESPGLTSCLAIAALVARSV